MKPQFSSLRAAKLTYLEKQWNPNVSIKADQKRLVQMSQDIKHFIIKSISSPDETQKIIDESNRSREKSMDSFEQISSTLNFKHHEGTDKGMELKVMKVILIRESLLMSLKHLVERSEKTNTLNGTNILELLSQIREKTLNYLEALCLWRQSTSSPSSTDNFLDENNNPNGQPRIFFWEYQNYTIKLINDLDFLAECPLVINTLHIIPEQFKCNPLMLSNNLEDLNTWMDPYDRAVQDTGGVSTGTDFESRLRLRFAERILLQEMESNNTNNSQTIFLTQQQQVNNVPSSYQPQYQQQPYQQQQAYYNGNGVDNDIFFYDNGGAMSDGNGGGGNGGLPNNYYYGNNHRNNDLMIGSSILEDDNENLDEEGNIFLFLSCFRLSFSHLLFLVENFNLVQQQQQQQSRHHQSYHEIDERIPSSDSSMSQRSIHPPYPQSRSFSGTSHPGDINNQNGFIMLNEVEEHYQCNDGSDIGFRPGMQPQKGSFQQQQELYGYGHDFFSGNWEENSSSNGSARGGDGMFDPKMMHQQQQQYGRGNNVPLPQQDLYSPEYMSSTINSGHYPPGISTGPSGGGMSAAVPGYFRDSDQGSTVRSIKSIDSLGDIDIKAMTTIKMPPKSAVLVGSVIIILLSKHDKVRKKNNDFLFFSFILSAPFPCCLDSN
jgi:hypothetical protein